MLYEAVCLIAHRGIRVADQVLTVFSPGKSCKKIYVAVKEHLVKISEISIHILITPAGVFRKLLIILVGITFLNRAFRSSLLEYFILVVAHAHKLAGSAVGVGCDGGKHQYYERECKDE